MPHDNIQLNYPYYIILAKVPVVDGARWVRVWITITHLRHYFVFCSQPSHTYRVSSQSDQGPRRYRYLTFDPDDLDLWSSSNHNSYSVINLHIPTKFHPNRTKDLEDTDIWPLTPMTLTFGPARTTIRIQWSTFTYPPNFNLIGPWSVEIRKP